MLPSIVTKRSRAVSSSLVVGRKHDSNVGDTWCSHVGSLFKLELLIANCIAETYKTKP